VVVSTRRNEKLRERVRAEIQAILDRYPNGQTYDRSELLSDIQHDLDQMKVRLGLSPNTPIRVDMDDGIVTVRLGTFEVN
jgi:hypothetical protein